MASASNDQYLIAGKITGAYGIKGWVKIHAFLDEPLEIASFATLLRRPGVNEPKPVKLLQVKAHGKGIVALVDGVSDRNQAELLAQCELLAPKDALPELEGDEYYWSELVGLKVVTRYSGSDQLLGSVESLFETGANDVMVVRPCEGSIDKRERLLPYLPEQVVLEIDLDNQVMLVDWDPEF